MLGRSEFRDSVDKILAGEAVDQDLQSVADWPKEITTLVYTEGPPAKFQQFVKKIIMTHYANLSVHLS